jgi:predicted P-loop ATPase
MFVSYDPELYHHQDSEIFTIPQDAGKPPQKSPSIHPIFNDKAKEVELLIEKIEASRADITGDYEQWLKIGFALASEFNVKGESYYHQISRFSPSYNPDTCKAQFKECCKNRKNGIAINTLFAIAKEHNIYVHEPAKNKTGKTKDVSSTKTATPGTNTKKRDNVFIEAENFINEHYDLRFNEVSNRIEERKKGSDIWKDLNENNIYRFLMHNNYALSMNKLTALLRSDFVEQFNPFEQYFKSLASYDNLKEPDYIKNLCGYVYAKEPERFEAQFKKHLVRCVACSIDNSYYNKQAFVIVHDKQNSGKSTFCRWLCPPELDRYFGENINLTNKDGEIALSEKFLINMDELAALSKYEINQLKSVFSRDKISLRRPFDRSTSDSPRRCSFFGSTNRNEFLFDETGSVRWLCFEIELIDWDYKKDIDINRVWAQAYSLFKTPGYKYDLDYNEIAENEAANERFFVNTPEEDLLKKMYSPGTEKNQDAFLTATDIQQKMQEACNNVLKLNSVVLGRILHKNRFVKVSKRYPNQQTIKGYHVLFN